MPNERITENIVRSLLARLGYANNPSCVIEEQQSDNPRIQKLLRGASKSGSGSGRPEFIISFKDDTEFLMVIECKADIAKHESVSRQEYRDYAVDGVLLYSSHLSMDYNVIAIAVSGEVEREIRVSHFLQLKGAYVAREITDKQLLDYESYKTSYETQSKPFRDEEITKKAVDINKLLHGYSVPETERSTIISALLISLQDPVFVDSFHKYPKNSGLVKAMLSACEGVLEQNEIEDSRKETILYQYAAIRHKQILISETVETKKGPRPNTILKDLMNDLKSTVLPFIKNKDFDILGRFYREFIRYAGTDQKTGLVLTPAHITDIFCVLGELNCDDIVYDPCCGTGGFLVSAMKHMIKDSGNNTKEREVIKRDRLVGVEIKSDMFTHACSNMMMRGDGKSNIFHGDCFNKDNVEKVKSFKPTRGFLNPPYGKAIGPQKQLRFVEHTLDCLEKGGLCVAICQISVATANSNTINIKKRLMDNHTLQAVFSMPDQLFSPIGVVTCILILKAHIPHPVSKEVFFGYLKDDGYVLRKNGRIDSGKWQGIKEKILDLYMNNRSEPGLSVTKVVDANSEWIAEAYMETDYSKLTERQFEDTILEYAVFLHSNRLVKYGNETSSE